MKSLICRLIMWAAPELFANPIRYVMISNGWIEHQGVFFGLRDWREAPWQITRPSVRVIGEGRPFEFVTYYRRQGSLSPVIYERLVQQ